MAAVCAILAKEFQPRVPYVRTLWVLIGNVCGKADNSELNRLSDPFEADTSVATENAPGRSG